MQSPRHLTPLCLALLLAGLQAPALAADTVLTFAGTCDNATCTASGANGSLPGAVTATLTLSDLSWQPRNTGGFEAIVSDAFNFGYTGPNSFLRVADGDPLNGDASYIFSATPSIDGITEFKIVWGTAPQGTGAPGLGFLSGDAAGWRWDGYTMLPVGPVWLPFPYDIHRSSQAWQWTAAAVPEPATLGLYGLGLGVVGLALRRRPRQPGGARP